MKVFICWSGRRSNQVAGILKTWLEDTFRNMCANYSETIEKGVQWSKAIRDELRDSHAGILCITPENLRSTWLHFEAGALSILSIDEDKKLFSLLYKAYPGQLESPLSQEQATQLTCEDTRRLCEDILKFSNEKIKKTEDKVKLKDEEPFEKRWSELERKLRHIDPLSVQEMIPEFERLFQRKTFFEPIDECTGQAWVDRYVGCYETHKLIGEKQRLIRENAWPHVADLYDELIMQLDFYAMDIKSLLVTGKKYELDRNGRLIMPEGVREACERDRMRVRDLVLKILTVQRGPMIDNARLYPKFKSLRDRNDQLVYPAEQMIRGYDFESLGLDEDDIERLPSSPWDFDRIIFYLIAENCLSQNTRELLIHVNRELERITVREEAACPMPLYHAVRAFHRGMANNASVTGETGLSTQKILERIKACLDAEPICFGAGSMNEDQTKSRSQRSGHRTYDRVIHDMRVFLEEIESFRRNRPTEKPI